MIRRSPAAAALAALVLALLTAMPALAGGWAEIVADPAPADPPVAGEEVEIGFTVMQHGVTPAPWESATVRFTELQSGRSFETAAVSTGDDGHFIATTTIPSAGFWTWTVTLGQLISDGVAFPLTVHTASGEAPVLDPTVVLAAIDAARREAEKASTSTLFIEMERVNTQLDTTRALADRLQREVVALQAQVSAGDATGAATDGPRSEELPILAVATIAILAGAAAGFAMAWLAGRPGPRNVDVALSPAPRGADPA